MTEVDDLTVCSACRVILTPKDRIVKEGGRSLCVRCSGKRGLAATPWPDAPVITAPPVPARAKDNSLHAEDLAGFIGWIAMAVAVIAGVLALIHLGDDDTAQAARLGATSLTCLIFSAGILCLARITHFLRQIARGDGDTP